MRTVQPMKTPSTKHFQSGRRDPNSSADRRYQTRSLNLKTSVKAAAREVTGAFLTCFSAQKSKAVKGDVRDRDLYQAKEVSCMFLFLEFHSSNNQITVSLIL